MGRFKTHAEWKQYGRRFGRRPHNPDRLWEVGDWWNEFDLLPPHERRKQTRKSMIEGADWDGPESYAVCKLAGEVARKFPPGVRQLSQLEWTKHEAIKSLPTDLRVQVLMQAAGEPKYWTVTRLRTERRKRRSPHWGKADGKDIVADIETLILLRRRYHHILADVPWPSIDEFNPYAGSAKHFPKLLMPDVLALRVPELAAEDYCFLHLWVPAHLALYEGRAVFDAWEFRCVGNRPWCKDKMGVGRYWRNAHETLYLGVRGKVPRFADDIETWFTAPRREYARKPDQVYDDIERIGEGPYLELFATHRRAGWDQYPTPPATELDAAD